MIHINWSNKTFNELNVYELYDILQLRSEVFVLEQNCPYLDPDGKDEPSYHLCGYVNGKLVAYARLIPPGIAFKEASIGRVLTSSEFRRFGAGKELMQKAIVLTLEIFNVTEISIGAQLYLQKFYKELGFEQSGPEYLEDNIPHIEMIFRK